MNRSPRFVVLLLPSLLAGAACSQDSEARSADAVSLQSDRTAPHGNHDPRYGGVVYMHGNLHFEVVFDPAGTHHVYFSDEGRAELPAAVVSGVRIELTRSDERSVEALAARIDESGESWVARGDRIGGSANARLSFMTAEGPYWIDVPVMLAPSPW